MKKMNILVTGGSGFIGKHLVENLLDRGHHVAVFDRSPKKLPNNVQVIKGDIEDAISIKKAMTGINIVYHLAGVLGTEELNSQALNATKINVLGALNVLEAAKQNRTKVLLVSKPNIWLNTYSITKEASEKFTQMYQKEFGLKAVIVKWFSVYGPGQKTYGVQKAVPTFIVKALANEPLPVYDDGKQMADFIYVTDAIKATILVAENEAVEGKTIEIGTGKGTQIIKLAKMIIKLTASKSRINFLPMRGGEDLHSAVIADISLLKNIGFIPRVNLHVGMIKTINYYKTAT